jgi:hypothetical protein
VKMRCEHIRTDTFLEVFMLKLFGSVLYSLVLWMFLAIAV